MDPQQNQNPLAPQPESLPNPNLVSPQNGQVPQPDAYTQPATFTAPSATVQQPSPIVSPSEPANYTSNPTLSTSTHKSKKLVVLIVVVVLIVLILGIVLLGHKSNKSLTNGSSSGTKGFTQAGSTNDNYTSSSGGFSVWLPSTPTQSAPAPVTVPGTNKKALVTKWLLDTDPINAYEVDSINIPSGVSVSATSVASALQSDTKQETETTVIYSKSITLNNTSVIEFEYIQPHLDGLSYPLYAYGLVTVINNKIYSLATLTTVNNDPNSTKFINSFTVN